MNESQSADVAELSAFDEALFERHLRIARRMGVSQLHPKYRNASTEPSTWRSCEASFVQYEGEVASASRANSRTPCSSGNLRAKASSRRRQIASMRWRLSSS